LSQPLLTGAGNLQEENMKDSQLKPWHIILFTVAILLVLWQLFGVVREKRRQSSATFQQGTTPTTISPNAPPDWRQIEQEK